MHESLCSKKFVLLVLHDKESDKKLVSLTVVMLGEKDTSFPPLLPLSFSFSFLLYIESPVVDAHALHLASFTLWILISMTQMI